MSIEQHAQAILDICTAGPIPGGISEKIKEQAQGIVDAMAWKDAQKVHPIRPGEYQVKDKADRIHTLFFLSSDRWQSDCVVEWRDLPS